MARGSRWPKRRQELELRGRFNGRANVLCRCELSLKSVAAGIRCWEFFREVTGRQHFPLRRGSAGGVGIFPSWKDIPAIFTIHRISAQLPAIQPRLENGGSRASGQMSGLVGGSEKCPKASRISHVTQEDNQQKCALRCICAGSLGLLGVLTSRPVRASTVGKTVAS